MRLLIPANDKNGHEITGYQQNASVSPYTPHRALLTSSQIIGNKYLWIQNKPYTEHAGHIKSGSEIRAAGLWGSKYRHKLVYHLDDITVFGS